MMEAETILNRECLDETFWGKAIIRAEKRGQFTDSNKDKAGDWQTCACGRQDKRIDRDDVGEPCDLLLRSLGSNFDVDVHLNSFTVAANTLVAIEQRSAEILRGK